MFMGLRLDRSKNTPFTAVPIIVIQSSKFCHISPAKIHHLFPSNSFCPLKLIFCARANFVQVTCWCGSFFCICICVGPASQGVLV